MIRFAWLQARTQTALALAGLVIVAIGLAITGPHLAHLYSTNVAACVAHGNCETAKAAFLRNDKQLRAWLDILVIVIPGVVGLFWGAPLIARELESGTYRLAWTQGVTRTHWLAVKIGLVGLASMAVAGLFSLLVGWWASPFDTVNANRFSPPNFDERGIVVLGFAAFAFALGVTAGVVIRRTLPAMATTLLAFVFARLAVIQWIRPHLIAPVHRVMALDPGSTGFGSTNSGASNLMAEAPNIPNAWIQSTRILDKTGHAITPRYLASACPRLNQDLRPPPGGSGHAVRVQAPDDVKSALHVCVAKVATKFHTVVTYQPAGRYWTFQLYELAIFLGAAFALSGFCFWWIRRRLS
jgi:hypothetical protein